MLIPLLYPGTIIPSPLEVAGRICVGGDLAEESHKTTTQRGFADGNMDITPTGHPFVARDLGLWLTLTSRTAVQPPV